MLCSTTAVVRSHTVTCRKADKLTCKLQGKSKSSNGAGEPGVPSQQDVKQQAKEARNWIKDWIKDWRKKQPSKADA